jgi:uncharacterized protein (TIGR00255 family)
VKSMTGYGRAQGVVAGRDVTVEVRCYNHRFKDVRLRLARGWLALEVKAETHIRSWLGRGRAECSVRSATGSPNLGKPTLDIDNALEYLRLYRELAKEMWKETGTEEAPGLSLVSRSEGVMVFGTALDNVDTAWSELEALLQVALNGADQMRKAEGEILKVDIEKRLSNIETVLENVAEVIPRENSALAGRIVERVKALAGQVEVSEERLAQEIAVLSERMDVAEELARLQSHISQFKKLIQKEIPVGRELDFLLQEMNREINTLSSKMQSGEVISLAVNLKAEVEKIREQVQNAE